MQQYAETEECREVFIRKYFGDMEAQPCGHCDNCLGVHKTEVQTTDEDFGRVREVLQKQACSWQFIQQETGLPTQVIREVLRVYIREQMVSASIRNPDEYQWIAH